MNADRRMRLWSLVVDLARGGPVGVEHVCAAVISATNVDSVAVTAVLSAVPREMVYASDEVAAELEELALTLGEGPCVDAVAGSVTLVADLTASDSVTRWPVFAPAAVHAGIGAVFALPLQVGAIRLGVMDLYRTRPGALGREQLADALVFADTACALLLDAAGGDLPSPNGHRPQQAGPHPEVHQATGMITVQLGVTAAVALIRLRAYAYAHDRRLRDVAADVVARRLRFTPDTGEDGGDG
jgi:hypothetical protein